MASESTSAAPASSDSSAKKRVEITELDPGLRATYSAEPGVVLFLNFAEDEVSFSREGESLLIHQDNGAVITLQGMFDPTHSDFPDIQLQGGDIITGKVMLESLFPEIRETVAGSPPSAPEGDFEPSAGKTSPPPPPPTPIGGGVGEYRDTVGDLLGSVDRFGFGPGADQWDNSTFRELDLQDTVPGAVSFSLDGAFGRGPGGPLARESGLEGGSGEAAGRFTGWYQMELPEGSQIDGIPVGGSAVFKGQYGEATVRHLSGSVYSYNYELQTVYQHVTAEADEVAVDGDIISFGVSKGSESITASIVIDIADDVPTLSVGAGAGPAGPGKPAWSGYEIIGEWSSHFGADGEKEGGGKRLTFIDEKGREQTVAFSLDEPVEVLVGGVRYGDVEFKSDGSYVFKTAVNIDASIRVVMGLTDNDNDLVRDNDGAGIVFDIKPPTKTLDPLGGRGEWFSEQNMRGGTAADSTQATKEILLPEDHSINTDLDGWEFLGFHSIWNGLEVNADVYVKSHSDPGSGNGHLTYFVTDEGRQRLTFTLESPLTHQAQGIDRSDPAYATVGTVTLVDAIGNFYEVGTRFTVFDDQPKLSMSGRGSAQSGYEYKGTWSLVYGADGAARDDDALAVSVSISYEQGGRERVVTVNGPISQGKAFTITDGTDTFGALTLRNGTFSFVPAPDREANFSFTLTGKDADGDVVSSDPFAVRVRLVVDPDLPDQLGDGVQLQEANLVADDRTPHSGTDPDEEALTQDIDIPAGYSIDVEGWAKTGGEAWILDGEYGYLTYSESAGGQSLSYTLTNAPQVPGHGYNISQDSIDIVLLDAGGNSVELPVVVEIADDVPITLFGSNDNQNAVLITSGALFDDGKWFVNYGADGAAGTGGLVLTASLGTHTVEKAVEPGGKPVVISLGGKEYGEMLFAEDGSYSFLAYPETDGQLTFMLTATDSDNDRISSSTFSVTIQAADGPDIPYLGHGKVFNEAHLDNGTDPHPASLTQQLDLPEGFRIDVASDIWTYQPGEGTYIARGEKGLLVCSGDGKKLEYTLTHTVLNNGTDTVEHDGLVGYDVISSIRLLDGNDNPFFLNARLQIQDDAPQVYFGNNKSFSVFSGGQVESARDEYWVKFGADGSAEEDAEALVVNVSVGNLISGPISIPPGGFEDISAGGVLYGTLHLNVEGGFRFEAAPNIGYPEPVQLKLSLLATDRDGDSDSTAETPATIIITKPTGPPDNYYIGGDKRFLEAYLPEGTRPGEGNLTQELAILEGYSIDTTGWDKGDSDTYTRKSADNSGVLTYHESGNTLTYTLESAARHNPPGQQGDNFYNDVFSGILLKDAGGNTYEVPARIAIRDDAPLLDVLSGGSGAIGSDIFDFTSKGDIQVRFGADGDGEEDVIHARVTFAFSRENGEIEEGSVLVELPRDGSPVAFKTAMGEGTLGFDNATGKLLYTYKALRGAQGESEQLLFAARDGDGDYGSAEVLLTLENSVPLLILNVDEAGLEIGSGASGHGLSTDSETMPSDDLPAEATGIVWDIAGIPLCEADSNGDGAYSAVVWQQKGVKLCGYVGDELVAEITPESGALGIFTGTMTAQIHKAFRHDSDSADDALRLIFNFHFEDAEGKGKSKAIALVIRDDEPFGNTGAANALDKDLSFEADESGGHREDVYLVVDVTFSISAEDMIKEIEAIRHLAEAYIENGVDASFTFIPFGGEIGNMRYDGISASELLQNLEATAEGVASIRAGAGIIGTNYTVALEETMRAVNEGFSDAERRFMDKKVYFLSDGAQTEDADRFLQNWPSFCKQYPEIGVYALGVGSHFSDPSSDAFAALVNVAGSPANVITVTDFDALDATLAGLVTPELGNLLDQVRSADHTKLLAIYIAELDETFQLADSGDGSGLKNTGKIDLGDGIGLVVYENGDYSLTTLQNVAEDTVFKIRLTVEDADKDVYTTRLMNFTVKDYIPQAYDNVAVQGLGYSDASVFGIFTLAMEQWNIDGWNIPSRPYMAGVLPDGMEPFKVDPILIPHAVRGCILLDAATTLSAGNVKGYIGENSLTGLLSDLGVASSPYVSDTSVSNVALISKEFTSSGGEIVFNWSFSGRSFSGEDDAAFWLLLDENDTVVAKGRFNEYPESLDEVQSFSGIGRVLVPESGSEQKYTFVIGAVDGGAENQSHARLALNTFVLLENRYDFSGNILSDPSPEGETDLLLDKAGIYQVVYNGRTYEFDDSGSDIVIDMDSGRFTLNRGGDYLFTAKNGDVGSVDEVVTYVLRDQDDDVTQPATLIIKGASSRAFTALAAEEEGYAAAQRLGSFEGNDEAATLSSSGWYITHSSQFATGEAQLADALPVQVDETLARFMGQPYPWVRMHGKDNFTPKQCFTLFDTNDGDEIRELLLAAGVAPETFVSEDPIPLAGAAMQKSFVSKGGEIAFGWSFTDGGGDKDAAFWMLKDKDGNITGSGLIHQGGKSNGIMRIEVPESAQAQDRVLVLGALKTGGAEDPEPILYVGNVTLLEDEYHFKGNVLAVADDDVAFYENAILASVTFGEETVHFDAHNQEHEITTASGRLQIDWKGNYTFRAADRDSSIEGEYFSYRLRGDDSEKSGELVVRMMDPIVHDTIADYLPDGGGHFAGNVFLQPSPLGEYDDVSATTHVCRVEYGGKVYEMTDEGMLSITTGNGGELVFHSDGRYSFTDGPGSDGSYAVEDFYYTVADGRGHMDSALLSIRGPQYQVGGGIDHAEVTDISYGGQDYVDISFGTGYILPEDAGAEGQGAPLLLIADALKAGESDLQGSSHSIDGETGNRGGAALDIFDESGQFKWNQHEGKGSVPAYSLSEDDKLLFNSLEEASENMEDLLGKHLLNLTLDTESNILTFEVVDELVAREIEIQFSPTADGAYNDLVADYQDAGSESAQQEVLAQFLLSLSGH